MVDHYPEPEVMKMRLAPRAPQGQAPPPPDVINSNVTGAVTSPAPPPWRFVITAADGAELLVLREENGMLVAEGDESRWTEAARRFVGVVLQWAGQARVPWKDEARKAAEGR